MNNRGFAVGLLVCWMAGTFMLFSGVAEWDKQRHEKQKTVDVKKGE